MKFNVGFPKWYHGATTLNFYRINNYESAYLEAVKYDTPGLVWGPMLRAACLGQINRINEAKQNMDDLQKLKPDFEEKALELISRYVKENSLVQHVLEGLQKAGLKS